MHADHQEPPRNELAQCRQQQAIYFFFGQIQPRLPGYWIEDLGSLYLSSSPSSIVAQTALAVSLSFTSLHPRLPHFKPLATRQYAECLRLVRETFDDPIAAVADETLIAVLLLAYFEVYCCCAQDDPDSLDLSVTLLDDILYTNGILVNQDEYPDYSTLSYEIKNLPKLRATFKRLSAAWSNGSLPIADTYAFLQNARKENMMLADWPFRRKHRTPHTSYSLPLAGTRGQDALYPSRIDIYHDATRATMHNTWRLAQASIFGMIAQTVGFLAASRTVSLGDAHKLSQLFHQTEEQIRGLVDDFCASIPYTINTNCMEEMLSYYPHAPGDAPLAQIPETNLIAGISQMLRLLVVSLRFYNIPHKQKEWLQQYLTMLSRNPEEDRKRAAT
ncbi:MAG: hypothetical protein Q9191_007510, partial [Dirinaria sp. TL-2023a]